MLLHNLTNENQGIISFFETNSVIFIVKVKP